MKRIFLFIFLAITISCNCQNRIDIFKKFINKFKEYSFPITSDTFQKLNLYANNEGNISKQEFDLFLKDNNDKFWVYMLYSKEHPDYFNYATALKVPLSINTNLIALIYFRAFLPDEYNRCKTDAVLAIYNPNGILISKLPILGSYSDTLSFESKLYSSEKIEISFKKTTYKKTVINNTNTFDPTEMIYIKNYYIQKNGNIVLKK